MKYDAELSNLFNGIIKIKINDKESTRYAISRKVFLHWFSLKSEIDKIKAQKHFPIECIISKPKDKQGIECFLTLIRRSLSKVDKSKRNKQKEIFNKSKNEETEYLFQVIAGWGTDTWNSYNTESCAYAGYVIDADKYGKEDAIMGIITDSDMQILSNYHIAENDVFHVYYHPESDSFSIMPSQEFIQKKYQKMRFKGRIVRQEGYRIIIESEGREFYAMMNKDINRKSLLNQFGFVIIPDMTVYISPTEDNDQWPKENTEVYIWKSK